MRVPVQVGFELSSKCNARCLMCPLKFTTRASKTMDEKLFRKIVRDLKELKPCSVAPSVFGEPLSDPSFVKRIKFLAKELPGTEIHIFTNGGLFTKEIGDALIEAGVKQVNFSLNAASPKTHEKVVGIKGYNKLVQKIIDFHGKAGKKMIVKVSFVRMAENAADEGLFKGFWETQGIRWCVLPMDNMALAKPITRDALKNKAIRLRRKIKGKSTSKACGRPFSSLQIFADGTAALCCRDVHGEVVVGDANSQSLKEIWEGPELGRIRELHKSGRRNEIPLCARCDYMGCDQD